MSGDDIDLHAIVLVRGNSRSALAAALEAQAMVIRNGHGDDIFGDDVRIVRQGSASGGEEAGRSRLWGVYPDGEGVSVDDVSALFCDEDDALAYAKERHADAAVLRTDLVLSAWNSFDPDPYNTEGA